MSERCLRCFRPKHHCLCSDISIIDAGIKFVVLMHPWEAKRQRTGTGRLTALSLKDAELIVSKDPDSSVRLQELCRDPRYRPVVLYPGKEASTASELSRSTCDGVGKRLLVVLVDATWSLARKMMGRSSLLQSLPRISFVRPYRSRFAFKTQPAEYCLSTIESAYYLIRELQEAGAVSGELCVEPLMELFARLIRFQLDCEKAGSAPPIQVETSAEDGSEQA